MDAFAAIRFRESFKSVRRRETTVWRSSLREKELTICKMFHEMKSSIFLTTLRFLSLRHVGLRRLEILGKSEAL